jgi:hypothetical protein
MKVNVAQATVRFGCRVEWTSFGALEAVFAALTVWLGRFAAQKAVSRRL